jgi:chromosome segregation ATPase
MSELPTIDSLKVAQRKLSKQAARITELEDNETNLEILAEALRDQRDEARSQLAEAERKLAENTPVLDITSLPVEK